MKRVSVRPVLLILLFIPLIALTACGGGIGPVLGPPPTYTLTVSPQPASIPVNGTVTFTATTNAPNPFIVWGIVGQADYPTVNMGSPESQSGMTYTYTAPPTPPIYQDPLTPPGSVTLRASQLASDVQFIVAITAPTVTTGFFSTTNTVALGKTLSISAYAVGSTNNGLTMQVNGTTGGSTTYGTIASLTNGFYGQYTYTAPATMPMTGNTVTVTVISQADPTKSSSMTVTLTSS